MAKPGPHKPVDEPRRNWPVAAVAAVGVVDAGYLAVTKLASATALFCEAGGGCDAVQASRYSVFLGLPTALWGALLYAAIGALALWGLTPRRWLWTFLLAVAGVSFSAYLTYLQLLVIRAVCSYCIASAAVALALFVLLLVGRPAPTGRRSPVRPQRVAALGGLVAIATIVFGAGVYAAGTSPERAAYQEALARHLAATGAVFYGAYW